MTNENLYFRHKPGEDDEEYAIYHNDTKIGQATLFFHPDHVFIDNIELDPKHQNKGYGSQLIRELKQRHGITQLIGDAAPDALGFWLKMGAVFNAESLDALDDDDDTTLVRFEIACP